MVIKPTAQNIFMNNNPTKKIELHCKAAKAELNRSRMLARTALNKMFNNIENDVATAHRIYRINRLATAPVIELDWAVIRFPVMAMYAVQTIRSQIRIFSREKPKPIPGFFL